MTPPALARISGNDENALFLDDRVGVRRGGAVGAFAQDFAIDAMSILRGDLIFDGRGNENVAGLEKHFLRGHFLAAGREIRKRFALAVDPVDQLGNVEATFVVEAAMDVGDADDFVAGLVHQRRRLASRRCQIPE